jgi:Holliday junction resolvase RusA-like endonuclease
MTIKLLTLPVSTNHMYGQRGGRRFLNVRARRNKEQLGWEARSQYRGKPLEGPLKAEIALFWGDRRRHDVDNIKGLLDALTGILWVDDAQIEDLRITKHIDRANPRVELAAVPLTL